PRCYVDCIIFGDRPCFDCLIYQVGHEERKDIGDWRAGYDDMDLSHCTIFAIKRNKEWSRRYWTEKYLSKGIRPDIR
ncbi:hypothetical protein PFISCL1PPCAC_21179, partial [Pristionchus fissidentatus]